MSLVLRTSRHAICCAGGAAVVEFDALVPGSLTMVDHSICRVDKGACLVAAVGATSGKCACLPP